MTLVEKIKLFNKNKSEILYKQILDEINPNRNKCIECSDDIYYSNSKFRIKNNGEIEILGNSFKTTKKHGHKLLICEKCLKNKFSKFNINKKTFNTLNIITKWAFRINDNDSNLYKTGVNLDKLISKYGKEEGEKRWKEYLEKQAFSNTLEYKKLKYGWDESDFKKFNKSRGTTQKNLISKYGKEEGEKRWKEYLEKQKYTKSFPYMINKFGIEKAKKINLSKAFTLNNFIKKYGKVLGFKKYENYIQKAFSFYSKISQDAFDKIDKILGKKYKTYFAQKNTEFGIHTSIGYKKLDYFIKDLNTVIEFNGDLFHGNPLYFKENEEPNPYNNIKCKEIWLKDKQRYEILKKEHNIKTIILWESEFRNKNFNIKTFLNKNGILF